MNAPWFRMHANLSDTKVVWRCAEALSISGATAAGHLAFFWGKVSQHATGGDINNVPDRLLEQWAGWAGTPGLFATFVREQHSVDGKVNDWDEYNGKLEERRARDRARKSKPRGGGDGDDGGISAGTPPEFHRNDGGSSAEAPRHPVGYETKRDDTSTAAACSLLLPPPDAGVPAHVRLTVAANQGTEAAIGEQAKPFNASHGAARLAELVAVDGIDIEVACQSVFRQAKRHAEKNGKRPGTLTYFAEGIREHWEAHLTRLDAKRFPIPEELPSASAADRRDGRGSSSSSPRSPRGGQAPPRPPSKLTNWQ